MLPPRLLEWGRRGNTANNESESEKASCLYGSETEEQAASLTLLVRLVWLPVWPPYTSGPPSCLLSSVHICASLHMGKTGISPELDPVDVKEGGCVLFSTDKHRTAAQSRTKNRTHGRLSFTLWKTCALTLMTSQFKHYGPSWSVQFSLSVLEGGQNRLSLIYLIRRDQKKQSRRTGCDCCAAKTFIQTWSLHPQKLSPVGIYLYELELLMRMPQWQRPARHEAWKRPGGPPLRGQILKLPQFGL